MQLSCKWTAIFPLLIVAAGVTVACNQTQAANSGNILRASPMGIDPIPLQWGKAGVVAKVELGRNLFFDARLSVDGTVSCATCHDPLSAFSLSERFATGVRGQVGHRKPPTIINAGYSRAQFWDARVATLEEQAAGPLMNPAEMGMSPASVVSILTGIPGYRPLFEKAFGDPGVSLARVTEAIATFERTVVSGNSAYDRFLAGDRGALSPEQSRGIAVFREGRCNACHEGKAFSNGALANLGVGTDKPGADPGRFAITHEEQDWGRFKTPGLRDVALRGPYMHDGSLKTLEEVVEFYDRGGIANRNLDNRIRPLHLTAAKKADLVAFLRALNGEGWQDATAPERLPQ